MKSNLIFNLLFLVDLLCIHVNCKTIVEMRFKEFVNPSNTLMNSKCCDTNMKLLGVSCFLECEHFFEISVNPYPGNKPRVSFIKTYMLARGKTTFSEKTELSRKHKNPWVFSYDKPYVSWQAFLN